MLNHFIYYICIFLGFNLFFCFDTVNAMSDRSLDLVKKCEEEVESSEFHGSCLTLGIIAQRLNHHDLFHKIEKICVEHYQKSSIINDHLDVLLSYYPQCQYVFQGIIRSQKKKKFNSREELKTLVRFLNTTVVQ